MMGGRTSFFRHNCFTIRAKTSLLQRLPAGLEGKMKPTEVAEREKEWNIPPCFDRKHGRNSCTNWCEIPCYLQHRYGEAAHHSCTDCGSYGSMLPPMVIFKGKRRLKLTTPEGVLNCVQTKAWMDEDLMKKYLENIWKPYVEETAERLCLPDLNALLTLDSFKAHTTDNIAKMMKEQDTTHCIIPGGCTSKLQPLDVSINKPFKQILKGCWTNFIHTLVIAAADHTAKIKTASKQKVLNWVVDAWQKMERKELIAKSFQVTGITSSDPGVVCSDEVPKRAMEAVQRELSLAEEDEEVRVIHL